MVYASGLAAGWTPEDMGSTSTAVYFIVRPEHPLARFDTTINYRRCAISFLMSVKRYRRLIFYARNFSAGKVCGFPMVSDELWRGPSRLTKISLFEWLKPEYCSIFFFFISLSLFFSLICRARIKDICMSVCSTFHRFFSGFIFFLFFTIYFTRIYRNKIRHKSPPFCCANNLRWTSLV